MLFLFNLQISAVHPADGILVCLPVFLKLTFPSPFQPKDMQPEVGRKTGCKTGSRLWYHTEVSLIKMLPKYYHNLGDFRSHLPKIINHYVTKILLKFRRFSVASTEILPSYRTVFYRNSIEINNRRLSLPGHIICPKLWPNFIQKFFGSRFYLIASLAIYYRSCKIFLAGFISIISIFSIYFQSKKWKECVIVCV